MTDSSGPGPDLPAAASPGPVPAETGSPETASPAADAGALLGGQGTFTIEGRAAPGLFVAGWILSLLGLGAVLVGLLSAGGGLGGVVFVAGMAILDVGVLLGAGGQSLERRARAIEPYCGPSPVLVLLASIVTVYLFAVAVGLPLAAAGITLPGPAAELLLVALHAATYAAITRLLVVGTGALGWAEMGFAGPLRRAVAEAAWGAVLAGPVIIATAGLSALLVAALKVTPASPLPVAGTTGGLALNLLSGAVLAPLGEELLFRGVATTAWVRSIGARGGIVRAALLFSLMHVLFLSGDSFGQALGLVTVGFVGRLPVALALGWVYVRRGSIWAPVGLHATFNAVLLVLAELGASGG